jgi:hypothetical protein
VLAPLHREAPIASVEVCSAVPPEKDEEESQAQSAAPDETADDSTDQSGSG